MSQKEPGDKICAGLQYPQLEACIGPPPPPVPPPSLTLALSDLQASANPAESPETVLQKIIEKLLDWGSLGGPAGLVITQTVPHIPQIGPKCGLVALNMALSVFLQRSVSVDELLDLARERKFTNHGEMFCVNNLRQLALNYLPEERVEIITSKELRSQDFVAQAIATGNLILVPYDSSRNFSPECLQGHKAHWAIIVGIVIPSITYFPDSPTPIMKLMEPGADAYQEAQRLLPNTNRMHVLALQGKSRHISAWPLPDLVESNENLKQLDPERQASELEYIVPEGGLQQGLCGMAILIHH